MASIITYQNLFGSYILNWIYVPTWHQLSASEFTDSLLCERTYSTGTKEVVCIKKTGLGKQGVSRFPSNKLKLKLKKKHALKSDIWPNNTYLPRSFQNIIYTIGPYKF